MSSDEKKVSTVRGACLCGAVQFELTLPTDGCAHCHCSICRRSNGAGYVTWVRLPSTQLRVTTGEEGLTTYQSTEKGRRSFCSTCGSSLFFRADDAPDHVDVVVANLLDPIDHAPMLHIFFSDRAEWVSVDDELPRLGGDSGYEPL